MLRKEVIPPPPDEALRQMEPYDFRTASLKRINAIADYLKKIPTVVDIGIPKGDDFYLMSIGVYPNVTDFLYEIKDQDDSPFYLQSNGEVEAGNVSVKDTDETYETWHRKYFNHSNTMNLTDFCKALVELGEMYEHAILQIEV